MWGWDALRLDKIREVTTSSSWKQMIPRPDPSRPEPSRTFKFLVFLLLPLIKAMTRREWRGAENFPEGGFIAVGNHISDADPLAFIHFLVGNGIYPAILGKQELFRFPILRNIFTAIGVIAVDRGAATAGKSLDIAVEALNAGACVVIYPEGTHTFDPDLWPMTAKTGAARLAITAGVPVVPIAQWGAQEFRHPHTGRFRIHRFRSQVLAGQPISLERFGDDPNDREVVTAATEEIMRQLTGLVSELRGEPAPVVPYDRRNGTPRTRHWAKTARKRKWT